VAPSPHRRDVARRIAALDPALGRIIAAHGPRRLPPRPPVAQRFETLAHSITHQQLGGRAAATIWSRVRATVPGAFTPEAVVAVDPDALAAAGLSGAKRAALVDLALHVLDGRVRLERLGYKTDADVVDELVQVRGIGPWTAEMFLMFTLRRPDVWPVGDLGVRAGWARAHGLVDLPDARRLAELGEPFRPHRSLVAWYCWRACEPFPA
jgi:DNA-3-methyladenine glycosylase II